jgi:S1-C subfamily serine protease
VGPGETREKERLGEHDSQTTLAAWQRRRRAATAVVAASALVLTGSLLGWGAHAAATDVSGHPAFAAPAAVVDQTAVAPRDSYAPLVAKVAPAVVTVLSDKRVKIAQQSPFMDDPSFRQFFGDRIPDRHCPAGRLHRHQPM